MSSLIESYLRAIERHTQHLSHYLMTYNIKRVYLKWSYAKIGERQLEKQYPRGFIERSADIEICHCRRLNHVEDSYKDGEHRFRRYAHIPYTS